MWISLSLTVKKVGNVGDEGDEDGDNEMLGKLNTPFASFDSRVENVVNVTEILVHQRSKLQYVGGASKKVESSFGTC